MNAKELYGPGFPRQINDNEPWELSVTQYNDRYAECHKRGNLIGYFRKKRIYWVFQPTGSYSDRIPRSKTLEGLYNNLVAYYDERDSYKTTDHCFAALESPMLSVSRGRCVEDESYASLSFIALGMNTPYMPSRKFGSKSRKYAEL